MELLLPRIERFAAEQPDRIALEQAERRLSYGELLNQVHSVAGALADLGMAKGGSAAVILSNSVDFVVIHLALMRVGAVTVPIRLEQPSADIAARLAQISPRMIVAAETAIRNLGESVASIPLRIATGSGAAQGWLSFDQAAANSVTVPAADLEPEDLAAILFTSGTTGAPRGVELTQQAFVHQAVQTGIALRVRPSDKIAATCSFANVFGLTLGVHLALASGAAVQIVAATDASNLAGFLHDHRTTIAIGSPRSFDTSDRVVESGSSPDEKSPLRCLITCGSRLAPEILQRLESTWRRPVYSGYGLTETCGLVSLRLFSLEELPESVGQPFGETEIEIVDERREPAAPGKAGRISLRGPAVMRGYWREPERTRDVIHDGWCLTDDVGSLDESSRLTVYGQSTETFRKGGFAVFASEVEDVLCAHPSVRDAAVVSVPDPVYGEELKAFIVCNGGASVAGNDVIDHLKTRLPIYKCPRIIKFCKELPRTPGGKIIRGLLRDDRA